MSLPDGPAEVCTLDRRPVLPCLLFGCSSFMVWWVLQLCLMMLSDKVLAPTDKTHFTAGSALLVAHKQARKGIYACRERRHVLYLRICLLKLLSS